MSKHMFDLISSTSPNATFWGPGLTPSVSYWTQMACLVATSDLQRWPQPSQLRNYSSWSNYAWRMEKSTGSHIKVVKVESIRLQEPPFPQPELRKWQLKQEKWAKAIKELQYKWKYSSSKKHYPTDHHNIASTLLRSLGSIKDKSAESYQYGVWNRINLSRTTWYAPEVFASSTAISFGLRPARTSMTNCTCSPHRFNLPLRTSIT